MGSGLEGLRSRNGWSGVVSVAPPEPSPYVTVNKSGEV